MYSVPQFFIFFLFLAVILYSFSVVFSYFRTVQRTVTNGPNNIHTHKNTCSFIYIHSRDSQPIEMP